MEKRIPLANGTILQERYKIIRLLGAGGMGAVYEAYNERTSAYIALKETFATDDYEISAFEREAKLLANLDHEALPRVMDYFSENDGYFLVMELIKGEDLSTLLAERGKPFEVETVLGWADQLLDALEDLHSKGIIHRDIKPANIKLTQRGKIKLIDFGIAKGTAGELTKVPTINAATNGYAPLEQVLRASEEAFQMLSVGFFDRTNEILQQGTDDRSDIYALGATLYQFLTNRSPASASTRALAIWSEQADRLVPAHKANPQLKQEVSEVLRKAMSLDREDRYQTAAEMRQMLKDAIKPVAVTKPMPSQPKPIINDYVSQATQPSPQPFKSEPAKSVPATESSRSPETPKQTEISSTFNRRNLIAGTIISIITLPLILIIWMNAPSKTDNPPNSSTPSKTSPVADKNPKTIVAHKGAVNSLAFSPDGKTIASGGGKKESSDFSVKLWDVQSGNLKQTLKDHNDDVTVLAFSPDGKTIASGSGGFSESPDNSVKLWDTATGSLKQDFALPERAGFVKFSPDGTNILTSTIGKGGYNISLWDVANGKELQKVNGGGDYASVLDISPDGATVASSRNNNTFELRDIMSGTVKLTIKDDVQWLSFSPDGKSIAVGANTQKETVRIYDAVTGSIKQTLSGHKDVIYHPPVAFSPDGKTIASGGDNEIILWDVASGNLKQKLQGSFRIFSLAFSPDGKTLASGGFSNIDLWRVE